MVEVKEENLLMKEPNKEYIEDIKKLIKFTEKIYKDRIEKIIFDQCKHLRDDQKKVEYEKVLKKINTLYSVAVLNSKNNLIIKTKADYYCYICNSGLEEDLIKKYQNFGKLTDSKGEK